jgi:type I restriction enzyme, S subunit
VSVLPKTSSPSQSAWRRVKLGDVCSKPQYGWTTKATQDGGGLKLLRTTDITSGQIDWSTVPFCTESPPDVEKYLVREGDILISRAGSVGVSHLVTSAQPAVFASYLIRFKPDPDVLPKYLAYFLQSPSYWKQIADNTAGIAVPNVNASKLQELELPLAPPDEQERIVSELEKQFSRLDEAVANLKRVKVNLKRYKAAVLKAAAVGRLVPTEAELARREGRSYESAEDLVKRTPAPPRPNRYSTRSQDVIPGHAALAVGHANEPIPEGWVWAALVDVARMESGHTPSRNHPEWWEGDIPWIGIVDAREHHGGAIKDTIQHTNEAGLANSAARLLPAGTVCVSRTASVGYVVVMGRPMATSQDFVNWIPTPAVTSDWLRIVFVADREALIRFGKGSVHKTIYFPEWLAVHVALPPIAEQRRITGEVDRRLSIVDAALDQADAQQERASALRRAVLARAFGSDAREKGVLEHLYPIPT